MTMNAKVLGFFLLLSIGAAQAANVRGTKTKNAEGRKLKDTTRVIIKYREGHENQVESFMAQDGGMEAFSDGQRVQSIPELGLLVGQVSPSLLDSLGNNPDVERVEPDVPRYMHVTSNFRKAERSLQQETPYGVTRVQAPDVWTQGFRGNGVTVCVIDSGIDSDHPDFDQSNLDGRDLFDDWNEDRCGHGTHVSGTAGAAGNQRVIGVAPEANIFTIRIFGNDCNQIFSSDLIRAALACRDGGARVISMSLGGGPPSQTEEETFDTLLSQNNILSIASAGNSGFSGRQYPASYPSIISIAATDSSDNRADFSQVNDQVDLAAPGVQVLSTLPQNNCVICQGDTSGYGFLDGTSMSCPHVSGVAALLFNAVPSANALDVRNAMESSARDLGQQGRDDFYGHGLVQAAAALRILQGNNNLPTLAPAPTPQPVAPVPTSTTPPQPFDDDFTFPVPAPTSNGGVNDDFFPNDDFFFPAPMPTMGGGNDDFFFPAPSPTGSGGGSDDFTFPNDDFFFPAPSPPGSGGGNDDFAFTPAPSRMGSSGGNDDFYFPVPSPTSMGGGNDDFYFPAPSPTGSGGGNDDWWSWDDDWSMGDDWGFTDDFGGFNDDFDFSFFGHH